MTLDEAIAMVDLMGWKVDAWRMDEGSAVDYDLKRADHREILSHPDGNDVFIDVKKGHRAESDFARDTYERPYDAAVEAFIQWVEDGMHDIRDRDEG